MNRVAPVPEERRGGTAEVLDVGEPLVEEYGHPLGRRGDDTGIELGRERGERRERPLSLVLGALEGS